MSAKRFTVIDYFKGATPVAAYESREEAGECGRNINSTTGHPVAVIDRKQPRGSRAVEVFGELKTAPEAVYRNRKSEIEIIGGFTDSKLKGREILGYNISTGWVHVAYLNDLPDYLSDNNYQTPSQRRIE